MSKSILQLSVGVGRTNIISRTFAADSSASIRIHDDRSEGCPFHPNPTESQQPRTANIQETKLNHVNPVAKLKPFTDIPTPKGLPIIGTHLEFFRSGGGKNLHFYTRKRHSELGPLYREVNSGLNVLFVGDNAAMQDIYKYETNSPALFNGSAAPYFNQIHNCKRGVFFMTGEEWRKYRRPLNNLILRKRDLSDLYDKTQDLLTPNFKQWAEIAATNNGHLSSIVKLVYEMEIRAMAAFIMGSSYDKYQSIVEADAANFQHFTSGFWKSNMQMIIIPAKWAHKLRLPVWKRFEESTFSLLKIGSNWVHNVAKDMALARPDYKGLAHMLLDDCQMETEDVARLLADIVIGSDQEANTLLWAFYTLGRHPEAQEKILEEMNKVCGPGKKLNHRDLEETEHLRNCLKEILRLYPVPVFTTRFLQQDAVVKGHHVPAGTLAALNLFTALRDPMYYPEPDRFWPERWERITNNSAENGENDLWDSEVGSNAKYVGALHNVKPYAAFGWGTRRGCVFRKVSLVRMSIIIGRLIQEFKFTCDEVKPTMVSVLVPDRNMNFKIVKRS